MIQNQVDKEKTQSAIQTKTIDGFCKAESKIKNLITWTRVRYGASVTIGTMAGYMVSSYASEINHIVGSIPITTLTEVAPVTGICVWGLSSICNHKYFKNKQIVLKRERAKYQYKLTRWGIKPPTPKQKTK